MLKHLAGTGRRPVMRLYAGMVMATVIASANAFGGHDASPIPVAFDEPQSVMRDELMRDEPVSTTGEDFARPLNAPVFPADRNNPSRRCGNVGNFMLDIDDLCQYAGAMRAASATTVVAQ